MGRALCSLLMAKRTEAELKHCFQSDSSCEGLVQRLLKGLWSCSDPTEASQPYAVMQPSSLQLPLTLKVLEFNPVLWDGEVVFFPLLHPLSSKPKLSLQMGSCVVALPFSTQFNRVMKWLPDSAGHALLWPPHSKGGPVKCRQSGWFPLMKYQYLHLHFQPTALAKHDTILTKSERSFRELEGPFPLPC